jgi:hypothetical protein
MTIDQLPEKLRVAGVQMFNPGDKPKVMIPESNMAALEQAAITILDKKESA